MKKLLSLMLALCLLLPLFSLADEDDDLIIEDIVEDTSEIDLNSENVFVDQETGEVFVLTDDEQEKLDELVETLDEDDLEIDPTQLDINPNLPENVINILLIGVDSKSKDPLDITGRGDAEIIVSINKDTKTIKMTSILRDSLVTVPPKNTKTKITNAFQYGCNSVKNGTTKEKVRAGALRAMRTVNYNFQMNIENYVAINFNGLASIIDELGGIDIDLASGEAWYINNYMKLHPPVYDNKAKGERIPLEEVSGVQHLDGLQAVMYARIRSKKNENDFNRTDRQRHLLDLLLQKVLQDADIYTFIDLVGIAAEYSDTNMNALFMVELAGSLLSTLTNITSGSLFEQMRVPMDHSYSYATVNGSSVVKYNLTKHAQAIHEFIYGTYYPAK